MTTKSELQAQNAELRATALGVAQVRKDLAAEQLRSFALQAEVKRLLADISSLKSREFKTDIPDGPQVAGLKARVSLLEREVSAK